MKTWQQQAKRNVLYALSKQLGEEVDFVEALELPFEVASVRIDELRQRSGATANDDAPIVAQQWEAVRNWDVRFGMVAKTVLQHYLRKSGNEPLPSPEEFARAVRLWFERVSAADRALRPQARSA